MIQVLLHGACGKMGRVVQSVIADDPELCIPFGVDAFPADAPFPVYTSFDALPETADVIIDFSTAQAVPALLAYAKQTKTPLVLCTTGVSAELEEQMQSASADVAILKSANMSVGVNLLLDLVQQAASILYDSGFDIEIIEKHHNQKIDAPSGTAIAIYDAVNQALENRLHPVCDRSQTRQKRIHTEVGLHAVRGGTIVGAHDVLFSGKDETFTLSHSATSKEIFAVGAVKACKFLYNQPPGLYTMKDVIAHSAL